ncbi:MAG: PepSY-associated TM helix domain-containing protein [Armatimonadota bacterium]
MTVRPVKRKKPLSFRNGLRLVHLTVGLLAGLVLTVTGITGALMQFEAEINEISRPDLWQVTPTATRVPLQTLKETAEAAHPGETVFFYRLPRRTDRAVVLQTAERRVFADPYTGTLKGDLDRKNPTRMEAFFKLVRDLHITLCSGETGTKIVGFSAIFLVLSLITGIILWWPKRLALLRQRLTVKWNARWRRVNYEAHSAFGFWMTLPLLCMGVSTIYWVFRPNITPLLVRLTKSAPAPRAPKLPASAPVPGTARPAVPVDRYLETAYAAVPGGISLLMSVPDPRRPMVRPVQVWMKTPDDPMPTGRTTVWVDPRDGALVRVDSAFQTSPADLIARYNYTVHTGDIAGLPGRILWAIGSLGLTFLFVGGIVIWRSRGAGVKNPPVRKISPRDAG